MRALFDAGVFIDRLDDFGRIPIHCASEHVEVQDLIALLLRSGVDLEAEVVLPGDNNYCHNHKTALQLARARPGLEANVQSFLGLVPRCRPHVSSQQ